MIGTVLDKYEILQKVGEGGMATVYRGRHLTLGRDVAIKVLHPHLSASVRNRQRFAREARAIEHLDHDNILKIYDYSGQDAEDCFIVTEFVDGVTLQRLIVDRGRLPSEVAALIGLELALALEYAHGAGIIHRDLKPENVMVRRDGAVKLMDFGIARFLDEANLTMTGALVGSPAYMSPEQAMERVLDPRSDLFSMGTLLYHVLTGQLPFSGGNPSIILRNIIDGNRPEVMELATDISGVMADLVERLMQTDPAGRPTNAAEVRAALRKSLDEVDIDPADPKWSLQAWLVEPGSYESRLKVHLKTVLLSQGKARLKANDTLTALRLLNRLLSIDEDNPEVLELVQGMHNAPPASTPERRRQATIAGAAGVLVVVGLSLWGVFRYRAADPPPPRDAGHVSPRPPESEPAEPTPPLGESSTEEHPPELAPVSAVNAAPSAPSPAPTGRDGGAVAAASGSVGPASAPSSSAASARRSAPPEATPEADPPAGVTVLVPGSWGDIYIDGELKGRTGKIEGAIPVTPGTHTLRVENNLALPYTTTFTVSPGEQSVIEVTALQRKPVVLRFESRLSGGCRLLVDDVERGTLQGLSWTFQIAEPDSHHQLALACPDGLVRRMTLPEVVPGAVLRPQFPEEAP